MAAKSNPWTRRTSRRNYFLRASVGAPGYAAAVAINKKADANSKLSLTFYLDQNI